MLNRHSTQHLALVRNHVRNDARDFTRALRAMRALCALCLVSLIAPSSGCIAGAVGALGQQIERGKKLDVPAQYDGLEEKTCAVVVMSDYATLVEHPEVVGNITANVAQRIRQYVKGASVLPPGQVLDWQYRTPQWRISGTAQPVRM
jgi:hypothetical protein